MPAWFYFQQVVLPMMAIAVLGFLGWTGLRILGRHLERRGGRLTGDEPAAVRAELERLRAEVDGMEEMRARVAEMEERLDFTERMLAQRRERGLRAPGR